MVTSSPKFNLKAYNTFGIDAIADEWVQYTSADDLPALMSRLAGERYMCIGAGSNMLFCGDYPGTLLHSAILDVTTELLDGGRMAVRAGSGITMDALIESVVSSGFWGLENLSGIPGEVGASAVQNVGAYGVEAADVIDSIECYDTVDERFITLKATDCGYGYRQSMFKNPDNKGRYIITHVTYIVSRLSGPTLSYGHLREAVGENPTPMDVRNAIIKMRNDKLPIVGEIGSAGSFFKNPVVSEAFFTTLVNEMGITPPNYVVADGRKIPAAWLIEQCGFKGIVYGNAGVWHKQPLVIVNHTGRSTAKEIVELENMIIKAVKEKFNIELNPEVEHIYAEL